MFTSLDVFKMSHAMAVHAGQKQAIAAQNVANSDTPGYKAMDLIAFSDTYATDVADPTMGAQRATRPGHLHGHEAVASADPIVDHSNAAAPNGNTVSLEGEMLKSLSAKRQHDRALAIYKSALTILRTSISSR
jgi:flagellar basal-body rod protein FlgB